MSSISSADRNRHTEEVRSAREEYENKEAKLRKKQQKEIEQLNRQHDEYVEGLKENYETRLDEVKNKSNKLLTERDQENNSKIEKLRSLYMDSLKKKTIDDEAKREAFEKSYSDQLRKERMIANQQKENLQSNFEKVISDKEKTYEETSLAANAQLKSKLNERAEVLSKKHEGELRLVQAERDRVKEQADLDLKNSRQVWKTRIDDSDRKHRTELSRVNESWMNEHREKEKRNNVLLNSRDLMLAEEKKNLGRDYAKRLDGKMEELDSSYLQLKEQAESRIDREVRSANNEVKKISNDRVLDMITNQRLRNLERGHIIEAYEDRFAKVNAERNQFLTEANRVADKRIQETTEKADNILQAQNRENHLQKLMSKEKFAEDIDRRDVEYKSQLQNLTNRTDNRVSQVLKDSNRSQQVMKKMHDENLNALKNSYADNLAEQREVQRGLLKDVYLRMDERVKSAEAKHALQKDQLVTNYENKLNDQEEFYQGELRKNQSTMNKRIELQKKQFQAEEAASQQRFEAKIAQLEQSHEKEVERLQQRHQEQLASLAQRLNYFKKKA